MTAINFPDSPSNGDTHVVGGVTYTYNSAETKWKTTINSNAFLPLTGGTVSGNIALDELHHRGDVDTNITFGTDEILFDTAGSERFRVGSAGQLGIGGATYGTSGQVLTSQGSSAAPQWATPASAVTTTNVDNLSNPAVNDVTVTGIPASATNIVIALANVSTTSTGSPVLNLQMGNGSMNTADYYWATNYRGDFVQQGNATSSIRLTHTDLNNSSNIYNGIIHISESNGRMAVTAQFGVTAAAVQIANTGGCWAGGGTIDRIRLFTSGDNFDNGRMSVHSW